MRSVQLMSKDIASRLLLIHPPEPRKELLLSNPADSIYIGKTRWLSVPVFWDPKKLINPHIAVVGITGSGKSYLVKTFITRASLIWGANAIILDWAGEYSHWVRQAGGTVLDLSKERLNLLDPAGMNKGERIRQIMSALKILSGTGEFPEESEQIESALEEAYSKSGTPEMADLLGILSEKKHSRAARMIGRLCAEGSDFFSGKSTMDFGQILTSGLVCLDLHSLPGEDMRSLAGLTILQFIKEKMRKSKVGENAGIKLFVVLDEAWKIASDERSDVIAIVREGRKYNFSLIVASQNPLDVHKSIISNVGTMFVMRMVLGEYRAYVQESLNYPEYIDRELSRFGVGDCAMHMIFSGKQSKAPTFLLKKVDGEAPLFAYVVRGVGMEMDIEREQFMRLLYDFGLNEEQASQVRSSFERGDGALSGDALVALLENFGYARGAILAFIRKLGIAEKEIVGMFSLARRRRSGRGIANIHLEKPAKEAVS
jgi:hypothetical protein